MTEFKYQNSLEYQGAEEADYIDTGNLCLQDKSLNNIVVYGNGGDDTLISTINYREGIDNIYGGKGDDLILAKAEGTNYAKAQFFGGRGADRVHLDASEIIWLEKEVDSTIVVSRNLKDGSELTSTIKHNVEYISFTDSNGIAKNFLTEDLAKGSVRAVYLEELNYRTTGENSDWFANDLDTYSQYHSGKNLQGSNGVDYLDGAGQNDKLVGLRGADVLLGLAGNDDLRAGNGRDTIAGGTEPPVVRHLKRSPRHLRRADTTWGDSGRDQGDPGRRTAKQNLVRSSLDETIFEVTRRRVNRWQKTCVVSVAWFCPLTTP